MGVAGAAAFMAQSPSFPPLMCGEGVGPRDDPLKVAVAAARTAEPGTVFWSSDPATMRAALLLAPETTLDRAMTMVFAVACGLHDALGALAPPEMALHHVWPDAIKANGAYCGVLRAACDVSGPGDSPTWLVVAVTVSLAANDDDPGRSPDVTNLADEGCVDLTAIRLIESWSRHTLVWINRWMDDGFAPLHEAWLARAEGHGGEITVGHAGAKHRGRFVGLDEFGDMLLDSADGMRQLALVSMLGAPREWPVRHR